MEPSPVRWGIIGTAHIARKVIRGIGHSRSSVVNAVASRDWSRAVEFAKEQGIPQPFGSYENLLRSTEVDAIYNPLPNSMHAEWTIRAMEAGKPVLCEKPFAATAAEAREMAEVSKRTGMLLAEAFMYRYHPVYARLFELLDSGAIGRVMTIDSTFAFRLADRHNIRASSELAGGSLMDVGCYCVNFSRMVAGAEPSRAVAFERRTTVDDTLVGLLEFPNGVLARFEGSIESYHRRRAEIAGTDGAIVIEDPWTPGEDQARIFLQRDKKEETIVAAGANVYQLEIEAFVRALRTHEPLRWPAEDGVKNMAVIDALYESTRKGKAVEVEEV